MSTAKSMLAYAIADIGYLEKKSNAQLNDKTANAGSNNYTKFGARFGMNGPDAYWCHMAVSCWARDSGNGAIIPWTALCDTGVSWFRSRGQFRARAGYTPVPGDIVYFSSAKYPHGGAHVGVVESCSDGVVHTIEGNTSGASGVISNGGGVCRKSYSTGHTAIYGYGHPNYEKEDEMLTYEQFVAYVNRYNKELAAKAPSAYAKDAVAAAKAEGVTDGTKPQAPLTREQFAVMAQRMGLIGKKGS